MSDYFSPRVCPYTKKFITFLGPELYALFDKCSGCTYESNETVFRNVDLSLVKDDDIAIVINVIPNITRLASILDYVLGEDEETFKVYKTWFSKLKDTVNSKYFTKDILNNINIELKKTLPEYQIVIYPPSSIKDYRTVELNFYYKIRVRFSEETGNVDIKGIYYNNCYSSFYKKLHTNVFNYLSAFVSNFLNDHVSHNINFKSDSDILKIKDEYIDHNIKSIQSLIKYLYMGIKMNYSKLLIKNLF